MDRALEIAEGLLALPTAPFCEDLPIRFVRDLAERAGLAAEQDAAGNVVVKAGPADGDGSPLVLVAHLDHPGFTVETVVGATASLAFRGGLALAAAAEGTPVDLFHPGDPEPSGHGRLLTADGPEGRLASATAEVLDGEATGGDLALWGVPPVAVEDGRITARACDDLVGAAAILSCLDALGPGAGRPVWGLFTRAEEVGLLGAFEAIRLGTVPKDAVVLSLECSKALPDAPQGSGAIVRVGDRFSVFDPEVTKGVERTARAAGVPHARKLMDGGTCEASAFCAAGYRASGLCIALGNYHNAEDAGAGVAAEHVLVGDYQAEVDLLLALAAAPLELDGTHVWFAERTEAARSSLGAA